MLTLLQIARTEACRLGAFCACADLVGKSIVFLNDAAITVLDAAREKGINRGLLWHIMQAYPSVEDLEKRGVVTGEEGAGFDGIGASDEASSSTPVGFGAATAAARSGVLRRLPYTRDLRRKLQSSLVQWLHDLGLLHEYDAAG